MHSLNLRNLNFISIFHRRQKIYQQNSVYQFVVPSVYVTPDQAWRFYYFLKYLVHPTHTRHGYPNFLCSIDLHISIEREDIVHIL